MGSVPALTACRQRPHCLRGLDIKVQRRLKSERGRRGEKRGNEGGYSEEKGRRKRDLGAGFSMSPPDRAAQ